MEDIIVLWLRQQPAVLMLLNSKETVVFSFGERGTAGSSAGVDCLTCRVSHVALVAVVVVLVVVVVALVVVVVALVVVVVVLG